MEQIALLMSSFLFGGMMLFAVGFGPIVLKNLEGKTARLFIRNTFPHFYLFVLVSSFLAAVTVFVFVPFGYEYLPGSDESVGATAAAPPLFT